jgi:hypothetical protein
MELMMIVALVGSLRHQKGPPQGCSRPNVFLQVKNDILFGLTSWFSAEIEFDKLDLGCG